MPPLQPEFSAPPHQFVKDRRFADAGKPDQQHAAGPTPGQRAGQILDDLLPAPGRGHLCRLEGDADLGQFAPAFAPGLGQGLVEALPGRVRSQIQRDDPQVQPLGALHHHQGEQALVLPAAQQGGADFILQSLGKIRARLRDHFQLEVREIGDAGSVMLPDDEGKRQIDRFPPRRGTMQGVDDEVDGPRLRGGRDLAFVDFRRIHLAEQIRRELEMFLEDPFRPVPERPDLRPEENLRAQLLPSVRAGLQMTGDRDDFDEEIQHAVSQ